MENTQLEIYISLQQSGKLPPLRKAAERLRNINHNRSMKTFFILTLILSFAKMQSQEKKGTVKDSLVWVKLTCEKGTEDAKSDFAKGIYKCSSYGLIFDNNSELTTFIDEYRNAKYGIITQNGGCVTNDYKVCYSELMITLVKEKFGADIFVKSKNEAEKLYAEKK